MSMAESFRDKTFLIDDADARIRKDNDLLSSAVYGPGDVLPPGAAVGKPKVIPKATKVKIAALKVVAISGSSDAVFADVSPADGGTRYGWTYTRNFKGEFINETIGALPPAPGAGMYGPNAAWTRGKYLSQIELVLIVDAKRSIKRIALATAEPYFKLVAAAAQAGILIAINSGFRSYPEQKALYDGYKKGLPGYNTAAPPGGSNHQNGVAFDIDVHGNFESPEYGWLRANATSFGFLRTVSKEPWHWEFDPTRAHSAKVNGTFKAPGVNP